MVRRTGTFAMARRTGLSRRSRHRATEKFGGNDVILGLNDDDDRSGLDELLTTTRRIGPGLTAPSGLTTRGGKNTFEKKGWQSLVVTAESECPNLNEPRPYPPLKPQHLSALVSFLPLSPSSSLASLTVSRHSRLRCLTSLSAWHSPFWTQPLVALCVLSPHSLKLSRHHPALASLAEELDSEPASGPSGGGRCHLLASAVSSVGQLPSFAVILSLSRC
ncbi:hypothetical protein Ahy_B05g075798 isoform G [Arachis hypogaea]|uniref:Uncharacterized protein n=1 Tax=Arachis hypogaea TaxID=3818 RepID=A0A444Z213_ARAHY|nr:hypothetical protein Ahy_B05g075798 isoform G [Arachis hypogaea]